MPKSKNTSPARSQGGTTTPRRNKPRGSRSVCSPSRSSASGRLTSVIDQYKENNMDSFALTPLNSRKSVLTDTTDIEEPRRKSWWKNLNDNSRDVMEVLENDKATASNAIEDIVDIEMLSQGKKNYTLDLPESSDNESINSIVIPQRKLFTQKENQPKKKFCQLVGTRETLAKLHKTNTTQNDKTITAGTKELFPGTKRSKPIFPAALLNISPNKTAADKTKENEAVEPRVPTRNIFGNRPANKRKNMFADFIMSESEDDISEIQPKVFGFRKAEEQRRVSTRNKAQSPTSSLTTDMELDEWKHLPSSTMVEIQLDEMLAGTPVKRARLSKLSEVKESEAGTLQTTTERTKQSNKSGASNNRSRKSSSIVSDKSRISAKNKTKEDLNRTKKSQTKRNTIIENENQNEEDEDFTLEYEDDEGLQEKNKTQAQSVLQKLNTDEQENDKATETSQIQNLEDQQISNKNLDNQKHDELNKKQEMRNVNIHTKENVDIREKVDDIDDLNIEHNKDNEDAEIQVSENKKPRGNKDLENVEMETDEVDNQQDIDNEIEPNIDGIENVVTKNNEDHNEIEMAKKSTNEFIKNNQHIANNQVVDNVQEKDKVPKDHLELSKREQKGIKVNEKEESKNSTPNNQEEIKDSKQKNKSIDKTQEMEENEDQVDQDEQDIDPETEQELESEVEQESEVEEETDVDGEVEIEAESEVEQETESEIEQESECEVELESEVEAEQESELEEEVECEVELEDESEFDDETAEKETEHKNESKAKENLSLKNVEKNKNKVIDNKVNASRENEEHSADNVHDIDDAIGSENDENESENTSREKEHSVEQASADKLESDVDNDAQDSEDEPSEDEIAQQSDEAAESQEIESEAEESDNEGDNQSDGNVDMTDDDAVVSGEISEAAQEQMDIDVNEQNQDTNKSQSEEIIEESPNVTHDTTGRNRKKMKSPEAILHEKTNRQDSFTVKGRNTSVRLTKSMYKDPNIRPSLAPQRDSIALSEGYSSAEGSGWDSHRTTRKTIRKTFGKDFSIRKSLRALVMEKSAKQVGQDNVETISDTAKFPQANSTEYQEDTNRDNFTVVSDHEVSRRTRQTTLENYLEKIKQQNVEKKMKMEEAIRNSIKAPMKDSLNLFKVPAVPPRRQIKPSNKNKPKSQIKSAILFDELPSEVIEDMKYKPPKRFQPTNASWITKRLYKFLESKLEPQYDYKARVRAEKLVETIYHFAKDLRRHNVASPNSVDNLKHEMARLEIVKTHFEFYEFFHEFMPREIRVKVVPDIVNNIPLPRRGVFTDIIKTNPVQA